MISVWILIIWFSGYNGGGSDTLSVGARRPVAVDVYFSEEACKSVANPESHGKGLPGTFYMLMGAAGAHADCLYVMSRPGEDAAKPYYENSK